MSSTVAARLSATLAAVAAQAESVGARLPRLVAVSKIKPAADVQEAYDAGQRHFGENYVQELVDKAPALPADVRWHFIGKLQSNKAAALVRGVPNLWMVESVESVKLANKLEGACAAAGREAPLGVLVQVNTSGEPQKGGVEPADCAQLARHIAADCPRLQLRGLMTIGRYGDTTPDCFECLARCREEVAAALGVDAQELELSMGMSGDFELAIAHGSTSVRVGSAIFGAREYRGSTPASGAAPPTVGPSSGVAGAGLS